MKEHLSLLNKRMMCRGLINPGRTVRGTNNHMDADIRADARVELYDVRTLLPGSTHPKTYKNKRNVSFYVVSSFPF